MSKSNNKKPSALKRRKEKTAFRGGFRFPDGTRITAVYNAEAQEWFISISILSEPECLEGIFKSLHYGLGYLGDGWRKKQKAQPPVIAAKESEAWE